MLNLDCFGTNYIGIRGECDPTPATPTSGIYVNDLPGVTLSLASHLATEDNVRGVTLLRQIEGQAIRQVWQDIKSKLLSDISINSVVDNRVSDVYETDPDLINYLDPVAADVGLVIYKTDCDPYTEVRINSISIRANSTASGVVLTLSDGLTPGCNSTAYTFDIEPCKPTTIITNFTSASGRVYATVNATALSLEDLGVRSNSCGCRRSCKCNRGGCFTIEGWDGTKEVGEAYGMIADVSCICSETQLLCSIQGEMALAVQMMMGILIAQDLLTTKRCNFMAKNSSEDAMNMLAFWLGNKGSDAPLRIDSAYWRLIGQITNGVKQSFNTKSSNCISCGKIKIIETLP